MTGKAIRLNRLFDARSQRSVTVAVDHGIGGVPTGLEHPREAVAAVLAGEPDGLILTPGLLKSCADLFAGRGRPALFGAADVAPGSTYPGGPDSLRTLVEASPVPVLILGGPKAETEREMLAGVAAALAAGVRGVAFGRNVFQHRDPVAAVRALRALIHESADVEAALKLCG